MCEQRSKTLKERTADFIKENPDLNRETLVSFVKGVMEKQEALTVTARRGESGEIECICMGDLCAIEIVPTEQQLGCERVDLICVGKNTREKERKRKEDYIEV